MDKRTRTIALVVTGAAVVALAYAVWDHFDEDDRPPILVKNDSISFEIGDRSVRWVRGTAQEKDERFWKQTPANWKKVSEFVLTGTGSAAGCDGFRGVLITVTRGGQKFQLQRNQDEPKIEDPTSQLRLVTGQEHRLVLEGSGGDIEITVAPQKQECRFPDGGQVEINYVYK